MLDLEKAEEPEIKLPTSVGSPKKQESYRKASTCALLTTPKPLSVWITTYCGKFWKRWECQTTLSASWEICMQVKKQQLEPNNGFSKQKSTICNDLGDREHIQERIFYTYLVICRGSWTRLRKGFYKATFFFFSMIYQKTKTNDPLSLRKQNTNIKEVTGLVKNDSSLSGKKDSGEGGCSSTRKSVWIWTLGPGMQVTLYVKPLRLSFSHQVTTVYWLLH